MKSSGEKTTPEAFYQQLAQVGGADLVAFARWVVENAPAHGLSVAWGNAGPLLRFAHEKHPHVPFSFGFQQLVKWVKGRMAGHWFVGGCTQPEAIGQDAKTRAAEFARDVTKGAC